MFCYALRIVIEIVREIEPAVGRQLVERVYLAFAGLQRRAHIFFRKGLKLHTTRLQSRDSKIVKLGVAEFACVFAVQPVEFVGIERCRAASNVFQIENSDDFIEVDFLPVVLWRPSEQTKIIADCRCEITAPEEILDEAATVALAP